MHTLNACLNEFGLTSLTVICVKWCRNVRICYFTSSFLGLKLWLKRQSVKIRIEYANMFISKLSEATLKLKFHKLQIITLHLAHYTILEDGHHLLVLWTGHNNGQWHFLWLFCSNTSPVCIMHKTVSWHVKGAYCPFKNQKKSSLVANMLIKCVYTRAVLIWYSVFVLFWWQPKPLYWK